MPEPVVSVIVPARNEACFITACLESIAGQEGVLEGIVVDNGSTDGTGAAVRRFAQDHPEFSLTVVEEPIPGVARAKNRGAGAARGGILLFLDADSRMVGPLADDVIRAHDQGSPAGSMRIVADSSHPVEQCFFWLMEVGKVLFGVRSQMLYCDRALFERLGGFAENHYLAEDLDLLRRAKEAVGTEHVAHVRSSAIATSPRRLRERPFHLGVIPVFVRWALAFAGLGRTRRY
ncbi:MAG TPA: glycosyltransferase [Chloroflexota bacterium]|nr:glycosyltransferase [Chloroflexota bacterium]